MTIIKTFIKFDLSPIKKEIVKKSNISINKIFKSYFSFRKIIFFENFI